jgi:tetratricopeptide (TPR) repeat protein
MKALAASISSQILAKFTNAVVPREILLLFAIILIAVIILALFYKTICHISKSYAQKSYTRSRLDEYTQTLLHQPGDSWTYFQKGLAHQEMKEHDQAIESFRLALQNHNGASGADEIHYHLGLSYNALQEKDLAFAEYKKIQAPDKAGELLNILLAVKT